LILAAALIAAIVLVGAFSVDNTAKRDRIEQLHAEVATLEAEKLSCGDGWYDSLAALQTCVVEVERERAR
jgi:hypothetical protein